jgi:dihydroxyacid dehydratase/phosphogluconate dehydratase
MIDFTDFTIMNNGKKTPMNESVLILKAKPADAPCWNAEVIYSREKPIKEHAGIAVLRGNLASGGR